MPSLHLENIPYPADVAELFSGFSDWPYSIWLDSSFERGFCDSRYDIFSATPAVVLSTYCGKTYKSSNNAQRQELNCDFSKAIEAEINQLPDRSTSSLPFVGGALGYWCYEYNQHQKSHLKPRLQIPGDNEAVVGIYLWAVVVDHQEQKAYLVAQQSVDSKQLNKIAETIKERLKASRAESAHNVAPPLNYQPENSRASYQVNFERISNYIHSGDCYQVNFAERFTADANQTNSFELYCYYRSKLPSPFSAYINFPGIKILSHSPERFLKVSGNQVSTKPIKGTIKRGSTEQLDLSNAECLKQSKKDRAENLMIVDLLRNDLGQLCEVGSVRVAKLFDLETYPNVHHLVSTIEAEKTDDRSALEIFDACFPGGSITGAPKLRAIQIIRELEANARGAYCGSIGYISACGNMDTNIAIRTQQIINSKAYCWAGGGLVADSTCEAEHAELQTKIDRLTQS